MKIGKSKLTRELLESYVGKDVRITFFDGDVREGVLELGNGFFYQPKKYVVGNLSRRHGYAKENRRAASGRFRPCGGEQRTLGQIRGA